ncbi:MAG: glycosyltransferase [Alphaproteobacteria bacterium]|nr:glycosyltransferase [Alphaproteobacteria bacterium]
MSQRRIAFTLPTLQAGGAERVITTLMNHLPREKFEPHFIVFDESGPIRGWIAPDIKFHSLGHVKTKFALAPLVRKLNEIKPDTVVSTIAAVNMVTILAQFFLAKKPRLIVRETAEPSAILKRQALPGLVRTAYKMLYPHTDTIIAPARHIIEAYKNEIGLDTKNCALLYNPVDSVKIRAQTPDVEISEGRKKTTHFIAAGRLHPDKGFDRLIASLVARAREDNWRLNILGEGPERAALESLITQNGLDHRVRLAGYSENPWPLYAAADAFLLSSRTEGMPNAALESLAAGTPVIAMKEAGGIGEIAALAKPGAVTIADTMEEFTGYMAKTTPDPAAQYRPSLLPEEFLLENVMKKFVSLL